MSAASAPSGLAKTGSLRVGSILLNKRLRATCELSSIPELSRNPCDGYGARGGGGRLFPRAAQRHRLHATARIVGDRQHRLSEPSTSVDQAPNCITFFPKVSICPRLGFMGGIIRYQPTSASVDTWRKFMDRSDQDSRVPNAACRTCNSVSQARRAYTVQTLRS
jgi:hypothetical protein